MMVSLLCVWNAVLILKYKKLLCRYCNLGMYMKDKEILMFKECYVGYFWLLLFNYKKLEQMKWKCRMYASVMDGYYEH
jgi:hypothetical protein